MTQLYLYTAWRTVISFGELRENRESGGEAAAKRREAPSGQWDKMRSCPVKERTGVIPQETHNGCSVFPLLRYLSFQCTSVRTGPPSSAPKQFSWKMNRNRVTSCGHTASLEEALPGTPLFLPQPALSHGDHTPFLTSAMVTTPLLQPQPALSYGDHTPSPTRVSPQPW